jgi:hypothetical protein
MAIDIKKPLLLVVEVLKTAIKIYGGVTLSPIFAKRWNTRN